MSAKRQLGTVVLSRRFLHSPFSSPEVLFRRMQQVPRASERGKHAMRRECGRHGYSIWDSSFTFQNSQQDKRWCILQNVHSTSYAAFAAYSSFSTSKHEQAHCRKILRRSSKKLGTTLRLEWTSKRKKVNVRRTENSFPS